MSWLLHKSKTNILNLVIIAALTILLFFLFYLKWIHLLFDVGREIYQAFAIATQGKTLYTELTHYFGPLAPYANATFLNLFGANLFNFSLIGLIISVLTSIFLYEIARTVLNPTQSLWAGLLFTSFAVINQGGGSLFMPYSYSHSYGILLTMMSLSLLLRLFKNYSLCKHLIFLISTSLLAFTKQEYLIVLIAFQVIWVWIVVQQYQTQILRIGLMHAVIQTIAIIGLYELFFKNYSVGELWEESRLMFQQQNQGILHNFLMLYSPSTLKLALICVFPITLTISFLLIKKKTGLGLALLVLSLLGLFAFYPVIINEFLQRGFLLNWITLSLGILSLYEIIRKKRRLNSMLIIILISLSLYNRQQSSSWMWQGLNWILFINVLDIIAKRFTIRYLNVVLPAILLILSLTSIPFKLNQGWDAVKVTNQWNEYIPVKKEWAEPIQQTVNFLQTLPDSTTVYTGQESSWLNVLTHKYNHIRNQQWWGFMAPSIEED